jgi:endoglycosylceramidase
MVAGFHVRHGAPRLLALAALGLGALGGGCAGSETTARPSAPISTGGGGTGGGAAGGTTSSTSGGAGGQAGAAGQGGGWPEPGAWRVESRRLLDPYGRQATLHGLNMAGSHKADGGSDYLGGETPEFYQRLHDAGFRALRFLTTWAAVMPSEGAVDAAYLDALELRLQWAEDAGLVVIVDMHQDLYGEGFTMAGWGYSIGDGAPVWSCPNDHQLSAEQSTWFLYYLDPAVAGCFDNFWNNGSTQAYFVQAWAAVAERLGAHPAVIGIDPLNEPGWGSLLNELTYENDDMVPLYGAVVTAVRTARPDLIAFVEPGGRKNVTGTTTMSSLPFGNAVYAPHMYSPTMEAGGQYVPSSHYSAFQDMLTTDRAEADALDSALLVGEWGSGISDEANLALFVGDVSDLLDASAVSWTLWEAGPGGGYCLTSSLDTFKPWASALATPYPERVNGTGLGYGYDPATGTLTLDFVAGDHAELPTLLAVPTSFGAPTLGSSTNVAALEPAGTGELALYAESANAAVHATIVW